jgi:hypothetical protein
MPKDRATEDQKRTSKRNKKICIGEDWAELGFRLGPDLAILIPDE